MRSPRKIEIFVENFSFALVAFLANLLNDIIDQEGFPSKMKYTGNISLQESGSVKEPQNSRPIALTNTISKVFKELLHQDKYCFLEQFKV